MLRCMKKNRQPPKPLVEFGCKTRHCVCVCVCVCVLPGRFQRFSDVCGSLPVCAQELRLNQLVVFKGQQLRYEKLRRGTFIFGKLGPDDNSADSFLFKLRAYVNCDYSTQNPQTLATIQNSPRCFQLPKKSCRATVYFLVQRAPWCREEVRKEGV